MVTCCAKIKSRDLKARIKIERKARTADGQGGFEVTWSQVGYPWAKWSPMTGSEQFQAMRVGSQVRVKAIIRFKGNSDGAPYYSAEDRVTYLGRTYGIESVTDIENMHRFLELMLTETAPS